MLQIYEKKLQHYQQGLQSIDSTEWSSKQAHAEGAKAVQTELDNLNRQYIDQVLWANRRLQEIKDVFTENNIDIQVQEVLQITSVLFRLLHSCSKLKS